jgi:hypothetical protein
LCANEVAFKCRTPSRGDAAERGASIDADKGRSQIASEYVLLGNLSNPAILGVMRRRRIRRHVGRPLGGIAATQHDGDNHDKDKGGCTADSAADNDCKRKRRSVGRGVGAATAVLVND